MVIGKCDIVDIVDAAGRVSASASGSLVQKAGLLKTRDGWLVLLKNRDRDKKG
jgi:hypothetical protein